MDTDQDKEIWIFLSHSNKDFAKVRLIRNYLEEHSCRPLMFYLKCLSNDDEINDLIKREIDCRTRFIICDSENSKASKWVQSEVDYIKSQQRTFETIDLRSSDEEIKKQLDSIIKKTNIFLSYSRMDYEIVKAVYSHIRKYDIRFFFDKESIPSGVDFKGELDRAIDMAKNYGFVVLFASESSLKSKFTMAEIQKSAKLGANIFILLLDEYAKNNIQEFSPNVVTKTQSGGFPLTESFLAKDISDVTSLEQKVERAIEEIVNRTFPFWDTFTMAKNFFEGIDCQKDEDEANRLFGIAYRKADELDSIGYPGGTLFVARCLANGYGTKKDLNGALCYYKDYIRICRSNDEIDKEIEAVERELQELQDS